MKTLTRNQLTALILITGCFFQAMVVSGQAVRVNIKVNSTVGMEETKPFEVVEENGFQSSDKGFTGRSHIVDALGTFKLKVVDLYGFSDSIDFKLESFVGIDYQLIDCKKYLSQFNAVDANVDGQRYTYLWNFGDGETSTLKNVQHKFPFNGTFKISLKISSSLCTTEYLKTVIVDPVPKLKYYDEIKLCEGDSVIQRVTNSYSRKWNDGTTADSIIIKQAGDYNAICASKNGCIDTLNFKVAFNKNNYTIQTDRNEISQDSKSVQLWSEYIPFTDYSWDFGDGTVGKGDKLEHTYDILKEGYFDINLTAVNPSGCNEYAKKRIWVVNNSITNTFTPNGDGKNEKFMEGWHLKIYNRNGILIFDGTEGWNGTYKGKLVSNGTYFYTLDYPSETGIKIKEGFVTVIR